MIKWISMCFLLAGIISCGKAPQDKSDILPPDASGKIYTSKRVPANMVDYIFTQMADTSSDLKNLMDKDEELIRDRAKWGDMISDYNKYEETYLTSALSLIQGHEFSDTVLRNQIYEGLNRMKQRQLGRTSWISESNNEVAKLEKSKQDKLIALKVLLTMPVLEEYLITHMPDSMVISKLKTDYLEQTRKIEIRTPQGVDTTSPALAPH
jgi:hypothetical protein